MSKIDTFEDLDCYKVARDFRKILVSWSKVLPKSEDYRLKDQLIRAARSITANIAEGFGRHHPQENLQFCRVSRGSLMEILEHLNTALDEDYLDAKTYQDFRARWEQVRLPLNGYISYLQKLSPKDRRFT